MALTGKVALVTGAGSGIGKATAVLLAKQGVRVEALSHTAEQIEQTANEIQQNGSEGMALVADTTQEDAMQRAVQKMIDRWGRIDIVFANAGINGVWAPIEELSLADWSHTITNNLMGTFLMIKHTVPYLKKQGGTLLITSSVNGTRVFSNTGSTAYSTTKAGQVAMAKMLAVELGPHNIRVNAICPGQTETEINQNTQRRIGQDQVPGTVSQRTNSPRRWQTCYLRASRRTCPVPGMEMPHQPHHRHGSLDRWWFLARGMVAEVSGQAAKNQQATIDSHAQVIYSSNNREMYVCQSGYWLAYQSVTQRNTVSVTRPFWKGLTNETDNEGRLWPASNARYGGILWAGAD